MIHLLPTLDFKTLSRFIAGGVVSLGVTLGTTAALHELLAVPERIAAAIGLATALVVNFVMLRYFVFHGARMPIVRQLFLFLGTSGAIRGLEYAGFFVLHLLGVHYLLSLVLVLGSSFILKFLFFDRFVFSRQPETDR